LPCGRTLVGGGFEFARVDRHYKETILRRTRVWPRVGRQFTAAGDGGYRVLKTSDRQIAGRGSAGEGDRVE
jgi:hypothetical protein